MKEEFKILNVLYSRYNNLYRTHRLQLFDINKLQEKCKTDHLLMLLGVINNNYTDRTLSDKKMLRWMGFIFCCNKFLKNDEISCILNKLINLYNFETVDLEFSEYLDINKYVNNLPDDIKYNHFTLGYIQGYLCCINVLRVDKERNYTRPLLKHY